MAARLGLLGRAVWGLITGLLCGIRWVFLALWRGLVRVVRLAETGRAVRRCERLRRDEFESLGKMVYVLFKRSLVRNVDLLAQCQKIHDIDVEIDQLMDTADRIRTARPAASESGAEAPRVADTPLEVEPPGSTPEPAAGEAESPV